MARRRSGGAAGLIDRVRWGNLGRLAAVIAACLLFVAAPRGGGPEVPAAGAVEEPLRSQSPGIEERLGPQAGGSLLGEGSEQIAPRGRGRRSRGERRKAGGGREGGEQGGRGKRKQRGHGNGEQSRAKSAAAPAPLEPTPPAPTPPAPAAPEPPRSTGEFL